MYKSRCHAVRAAGRHLTSGSFRGCKRLAALCSQGTLHRISALRNRKGTVVGLTCRVGRAVTGHMDMIRDMIEGAPASHRCAILDLIQPCLRLQCQPGRPAPAGTRRRPLRVKQSTSRASGLAV